MNNRREKIDNAFGKVGSGLLIIIVVLLLFLAIRNGYQPRIEIIKGHEYLVIPGEYGDNIEHSPDCKFDK